MNRFFKYALKVITLGLYSDRHRITKKLVVKIEEIINKIANSKVAKETKKIVETATVLEPDETKQTVAEELNKETKINPVLKIEYNKDKQEFEVEVKA